MRRESGCESGCQLGRQAGHAWGLGPQAHGGGGAAREGEHSPDASSKLITRVIYTDKFQLQTQFLLMQAWPLLREGMCMRHGRVWRALGAEWEQVCVSKHGGWAILCKILASLYFP